MSFITTIFLPNKQAMQFIAFVCYSVGIALASDNRGPRFEWRESPNFNHQLKHNCIENNEKDVGDCPIKKVWMSNKLYG